MRFHGSPFSNPYIELLFTDGRVDLTAPSPIPAHLRHRIRSHIDAELRDVLRAMCRHCDDRRVLLFPTTVIDLDTGERHDEWSYVGPGCTPDEYVNEKNMAASSRRPYVEFFVVSSYAETYVASHTYNSGL